MGWSLPDALAAVESALDRTQENVGESLLAASLAHLSDEAEDFDLASSALGFDTNAVFRLIRMRSADAIDYLDTKHEGPLVLPGQVINEVWNQDEVLPEAAEKVVGTLNQLRSQLQQLDEILADDALPALVADLDESSWMEFESLGQAQERLRLFLDVVARRGVTPHVPRTHFGNLGVLRLSSKVPPGFKDRSKAVNELGDFFVWSDFLLGCRLLANEATSAIVFVTNEKKKDWVTSRRRPHPVLVAEARALFGLPFRILSTEEFRSRTAEE